MMRLLKYISTWLAKLDSRCLGPPTLFLDRSASRERPSQHAFVLAPSRKFASRNVLGRFVAFGSPIDLSDSILLSSFVLSFGPRLNYRPQHVFSYYGRLGYSCSSCRPAASFAEPSPAGKYCLKVVALVYTSVLCPTKNAKCT